MQKVEIYYDVVKAAKDMGNHIQEGWRVHTCTIGSTRGPYERSDILLVVYER